MHNVGYRQIVLMLNLCTFLVLHRHDSPGVSHGFRYSVGNMDLQGHTKSAIEACSKVWVRGGGGSNLGEGCPCKTTSPARAVLTCTRTVSKLAATCTEVLTSVGERAMKNFSASSLHANKTTCLSANRIGRRERREEFS